MSQVLPIIKLDYVYHAGIFSGVPNEPTGSYEYGQFSISLTPQTWMRIMKKGNFDVFEMHKKNNSYGRFLMIRHLDTNTKKNIFKKYEAEKFLTFENRYLILYGYDESNENPQYSLCRTKEEANIEAIKIVELEYDTAVKIKKVERYIATPKLLSLIGATPGQADDGEEIAIMAWAMGLDLDGIWWDEQYRPEEYSAPRGCIFQNKMENWIATKNNFVDEWYNEKENLGCVKITHIKKHKDIFYTEV